jgi:hypothetical protein
MILRYATNKFGEPICGGGITPGKQGDKLVAARERLIYYPLVFKTLGCELRVEPQEECFGLAV